MREEDQELGLEPVDERQDLPRVVEEAHEVLAGYGWQVLGLGVGAAALWGALFAAGLFFPIQWLLMVLVALGVVYFFPVSREPRLAKDVIRRWDHLRVDRALESSGLATDPRLEVAESLGPTTPTTVVTPPAPCRTSRISWTPGWETSWASWPNSMGRWFCGTAPPWTVW